MREKRYLWDGVRLPEWDADRCYDLFKRHVAGAATEQDSDDYLRLLMVFISANMGRRKWIPSLRRRQIDPEEAAQDLLLFLFGRAAKFRLKVDVCQVFLQALNTTIYRYLVSLVRKGGDEPLVVAASQCGDDDDGAGMLDVPAPEEMSVRRLSAYLRDAEDANLRDVPGDVFDLIKCYRLVARAVVRRNALAPWAQLPARLRRRISTQQHALIAYRINRSVLDYAADPEFGADPAD